MNMTIEINDLDEYRHQLYLRKPNGRYVEANDPYALDGLRNGVWLVIVKPGSKTIRSPVFPDRLAISAALEEFREELIEAMNEAQKAYPRPKTAPLSEKELEAIKAYREVMGEDDLDSFVWDGMSLSDIVDKAIDSIKNPCYDRQRD